jgi:hypothetical protein
VINIKNHPALKGVTIPRTGRPGRNGTLITKTLVIFNVFDELRRIAPTR